jgi:hypothetical protein
MKKLTLIITIVAIVLVLLALNFTNLTGKATTTKSVKITVTPDPFTADFGRLVVAVSHNVPIDNNVEILRDTPTKPVVMSFRLDSCLQAPYRESSQCSTIQSPSIGDVDIKVDRTASLAGIGDSLKPGTYFIRVKEPGKGQNILAEEPFEIL